jgi:hypothetical protein
MRALLVGFASRQALQQGFDHLTAARIETLETYSPMPLEEDATSSPLPLLMFVAGIGGFIGFFLLMTYADVRAYPLDIGGRPKFAWPAFVPIAFELGVLCAMVAGFFGYFIICRMPKLYEPIDGCVGFKEASRDGWFLTIESEDPERLAEARALIEPLRPASIEEFCE